MSGKFSVLIISTEFILLPNTTNQSESSSSRRAKEKSPFGGPLSSMKMSLQKVIP